MKTLIFIVSVCALTLPALAADVDITAVDKGGGVLGINYTAAVGHGPRGFAILVTLTDADIDGIDDVLSVHSAYNVNIDYAYSQELAVPGSYVIGSGHPLADPGGPGEVSVFPATTFVISVGVLDEGGNQAAGPEGGPIELVALQLTGDSPYYTVTLAADVSRGGPVVTDNPESTWSVTGIIPPPIGPACWNDTQCKGDADNDGDVDTADWPTFRNAFPSAYPDAKYDPCADFDRDGDVDTADWPAFRNNFPGAVTPTCAPGGTWPPLP